MIFYRKLTSYNFPYSELFRKTCLELAKNYLENSKLSLTEIAFLLGYAEQIAFRRAFKQWKIFLHLNIERYILYQLK
nr:AraC family transcriptional regulator [Acinetobacter courvalinii]